MAVTFATSSLAPRAPADARWVSGIEFRQGELVVNGGTTYVAVDAHISGASFLGDAAHWTPLGTGEEIDTAERATTLDVQAIGAVSTAVDGLSINVPPQVRPFEVRFQGLATLGTGTAAANTQQGLQVQVMDVTSGSPVAYDYCAYYVAAVTTTARSYNTIIRCQRRFPPNAATRRFVVYVRTAIATPSGWGSVNLYGGDTPTQDVYPPVTLSAVRR